MTGTTFIAHARVRARRRDSRWLRWIGNPFCYGIGMPILTICGLAASLVIPRFLPPAQFGAYALLLDLCRYAMRADLGLSQLADRRIAAGLDSFDAKREANDILAARWQLGKIAITILVPAAAAFSIAVRVITPLDAVLATSAGVVAMIAGGPSSIYRARGDVWMYTTLTFMFGVGFIIPRLVGVILGGTTGCFALLLLWYALVAAAFSRTFTAAHDIRAQTRKLVRAALPLFVFSAVWTLYLSASRWLAAWLCTPVDLGMFALSANLVFTGVTTIGLIADVRYPRWLRRLSNGDTETHAKAIAREGMLIAVPIAVGTAVLVPLSPTLLGTFFPNYTNAAPSLAALACASVPLGVFAWFLPVMIARSSHPAKDAAIVFLPAALVLLLAMAAGQKLGGLQGQAFGGCASAIAALGGMALVLARSGVLTKRWALYFFSIPTVCVLFPLLAILLTQSTQNLSYRVPRCSSSATTCQALGSRP